MGTKFTSGNIILTTKPSKVLVIDSGPIVIGQEAEFEYTGTQACEEAI